MAILNYIDACSRFEKQTDIYSRDVVLYLPIRLEQIEGSRKHAERHAGGKLQEQGTSSSGSSQKLLATHPCICNAVRIPIEW